MKKLFKIILRILANLAITFCLYLVFGSLISAFINLFLEHNTFRAFYNLGHVFMSALLGVEIYFVILNRVEIHE